MRKTATRLTKVSINKRRFYCVTWPKIGPGRNRRFFKEKSQAEAFLEQKKIEERNYGTAGLAFTESQRSEYLECSKILQPFGVTLRDAVKFFLPHLKTANRSCSVAELAKEHIATKKADGVSTRYLADLRSKLGQFSATFGEKSVAEMTATDIDLWLRRLSSVGTGRGLSPTTRNNFRRVLLSTFNFAHNRGYSATNPANTSAKAKEIEKPVGILTPAETARLLESCSACLLAFVAIGAFAGLRRSEIERLDWSDVDLETGFIEVKAINAKSARRRSVKIQPNLRKWLELVKRPNGQVAPRAYEQLLAEARQHAGIQIWPHNALRHSFASYHLEYFKNTAALALELGHTNSSLVFQHYRQVVKPQQAESYWGIVPSPRNKKVIHFASVSS